MAGLTGVYNTVPKLRALNSRKTIVSVLGANPVDTTVIALPNVRGQVGITITASDTGHVATFQVVGGFGSWPGQPTLDWYYSVPTAIGCVVTTIFKNRLQIVTPVADAGGRVYIMNFSPLAAFSPDITQTSLNVLGVADLAVSLTKTLLVEGF